MRYGRRKASDTLIVWGWNGLMETTIMTGGSLVWPDSKSNQKGENVVESVLKCG